MLTGKQKRYLRREAHHLSPIFQVGKGESTKIWSNKSAKLLKQEN